MKDEPIRVYTVAEVSQELGLSKSRVLQFVHQGRLYASKVGSKKNGLIIITEAAIALFKRQERKAGRPPKPKPRVKSPIRTFRKLTREIDQIKANEAALQAEMP